MTKAKKDGRVIPKRIAGVKVPKKVRKGPFGELLASKSGQALIAQAIQGANAAAPPGGAKPARRGRGQAAKDAEAMRWTPDYGAPEAPTN